ncbi:uncharacterized protein METZ01_LOCUS395504, partial [marine metagenome]
KFYKKKIKINLAIDYNGGHSKSIFWDFINSKKNKTLIVVRDKLTEESYSKDYKDYNSTFDNEGFINFLEAPLIWAKSVIESFKLYFNNFNLPSDYYRQICFIPNKRVKYKAFFNKYNCKYFLGRDDYNYQHIIRNQEIRKIKGCSFGLNHGIDSINKVAFQLRYIDWDFYYMHGLYQFNNIYKKYWPKKMKVRGIGAMMANPNQHIKIKSKSEKNIAIIVAPSYHQKLIFKSIEELAIFFPSIKFYIFTKWKHRNVGTFGKLYQNLIKSRLKNVQECLQPVYDMLHK